MRKNAIISILFVLILLLAAGCGKQESKAPVPDGTYEVKVKTDSTMFHINEAHKGMGTLTVKDGKNNVKNLFTDCRNCQCSGGQITRRKILEKIYRKLKEPVHKSRF